MKSGNGAKPRRSLNRLKTLRAILVHLKWLYYTKVWKMDIHPSAQFSLSARLDRTNPRGIHIGPETYIAFEAAILTHDTTRGLYLDTTIGRRCFIGARSVILPGITIGDECVIGAGSVVTKDIPSNSLVVGNPARVIREDLKVTSRYGRIDIDQEHQAVAATDATIAAETRKAI